MNKLLMPSLPVPPALVYLLNQLDQAGIGYHLYGEVVEANLVFVDIDRELTKSLDATQLPVDWSLITPHFLAQRAIGKGETDPIAEGEHAVEAIVLAYGDKEAESYENFQALCEQVRYLRQMSPSRLVYQSLKPPEPMEIQAIIQLIKRMAP